MHIIGKRHHDEDVLKASRMYEKAYPWKNLYKYSM
jgi:hypothetical protein